MFFMSYCSFIPFSLTCSIGGAAFYGIFIQEWRYSFISFLVIIEYILIFATCIAIVAGVLAFIIKILTMIIGFLMQLIGTPDKIHLERYNDGKFVGVKFFNGEKEKFVGEFKILRINDEILITPLIMGVIRGENIEQQIVIPKEENIGIQIGYFDDDSGSAYFTDVYRQKRILYDQTRIYTKLSGNLECGEQIIKEKSWFVRYKTSDKGTELSLSDLIEIWNHIGIKDINLKTKLSS